MSPVVRSGRGSAARRRDGVPSLLAAALVIAAAGALTFYAFNQGLPFIHHFTLSALVSDSVAVRSGSPVRIAGVDVGSVDGVTRGPGQASKVTFELDSDAGLIHADATVRIRPRTFLEGGYYLDLMPGSPSARALPEGATIPLSHTRPPVQAYRILSAFDLPVRRSLQRLVDTLAIALGPYRGRAPTPDSGAAALRRALPQFAPTLKDLAWVAQGLRGTGALDLLGVIENGARVSRTLQRRDAELADLVGSLDRTARALASSDGALAQSISGLDTLLQTSPRALSAIDAALPPVTQLAGALIPSLRPAPVLVERIIEAARELGALVAPAERARLLRAARSVFADLPVLLTRLGRLLPAGKAVTDCLRTHITPILNAKLDDGALSSGQTVAAEFVHAMPGLAGSAQSFDGNGYWLRVLSGIATNTVDVALPGAGTLLGTTPGNSPITGARPRWFGPLTADAFHPEVPCTSQPLPNPNAPAAAAAPDVTNLAGAAAAERAATAARLRRLRDQALARRHG